MKLRAFTPAPKASAPIGSATHAHTPRAMPNTSPTSRIASTPNRTDDGAVAGMSAHLPEPAASVPVSGYHGKGTVGAGQAVPAVTHAATPTSSGAEDAAPAFADGQEAALQDGGAASTARRGRPALVERLTAEQILIIRRIALDLPLRTDTVSHSLALRLFAERPEAPQWLRDWAANRHSKHHIPRSIMEAIRLSERLVAHDQAPGRERLNHEAFSPGTMRLGLDGQRLQGGECESWDDASVNFLLWAEIDGQVRCGRFQLLLGVDHATDYVVGFAFVARPRDSYRSEDALGRAMLPTWRAHGAPKRVVLERGVWEAGRIADALTALRVQRSTSYHPRTKLVESVFNRLWTRLGDQPGAVGRTRGDNEWGNELLRKIRAGTLDAREHCLSIEQARTAVAAACAAHNREPVESRHYGRWIPEQRWTAEAPQHLRPLDMAGSWAAMPERRKLMIRRGGMVVAEVDTGWDYSMRFEWGSEELWNKVGREAVVYFDPQNADEAVIVDPSTRAVLARAKLLTGNAAAGVDLRRAQSQLVRSEHVALAAAGKIQAATSERYDSAETVSSTVSRTAPASEPARPARREPAPAPLAARARPITPEAEPDIDLAELEAREAAARAAGLLPAY